MSLERILFTLAVGVARITLAEASPWLDRYPDATSPCGDGIRLTLAIFALDQLGVYNCAVTKSRGSDHRSAGESRRPWQETLPGYEIHFRSNSIIKKKK